MPEIADCSDCRRHPEPVPHRSCKRRQDAVSPTRVSPPRDLERRDWLETEIPVARALIASGRRLPIPSTAN